MKEVTTKIVTENKEPPTTVEHLEASSDETTNDSHPPATGQTVSETQHTVHDKSESVKWVIDNNFRKELIRLGISEDPVEWLGMELRNDFSFLLKFQFPFKFFQDRCSSTTLAAMGCATI